MNYTGERVIPFEMNPKSGILMEHIARYEFARQFCKGRVLDIACGVGYGSDILLEEKPNITEYIGIDSSIESINYAKEHYPYLKTSYFVEDALNENLHQKYGTFDTIVSFETIEHFEGDNIFINNLYNLLKPDGTLIISTPFGRGKDHPCSCPYHVYQYTEEEFVKVLKTFSNITMYHQIDDVIEIPKPDFKYYLMVAVCQK
ncbi:class I SAM-dependent methyltransferase [Alkaliphilus hydrothermalis]|uniref:2-polyprenyl-3-methyl-5-hydroxy-6-metoxy-1, 4-benzoquinol methylase n=1 Tax=Alkaliphilus hydrothermalis TaxID=1482730 RepID=A0ABS2NPF3_9FIRM|nr:class I SAM-dependent methyltransferase [Alkaliphilus hydrothermalis]MBM7614812.1 2-polyprenyl-3-methyl-5-hydroxy-6-metoxy-1,4-benzoquinol methylase [Alkaliphilus hydrothermalis]